MFKVGDKVEITATDSELRTECCNPKLQTGGIHVIENSMNYQGQDWYQLNKELGNTWVSASMLKLVTKKKAGAKKGVPHRQFDVTFKQGIVRSVRAIRRAKIRGGIKSILEQHNITDKHLAYWEKQFDEGHFSSERAVAFSRKKEMIHG